MKIVVRVPNWIGDAIFALPALNSLRAAFPGAEIWLAGAPWAGDLMSGGAFDANRVCAHLSDDALTSVVVDLCTEGAGKGKEKEHFAAALKAWRLDLCRRRLQELKGEMAEAAAGGDEQKANELYRRRHELQKEVELLKRHRDLMK